MDCSSQALDGPMHQRVIRHANDSAEDFHAAILSFMPFSFS
jgi:hypothetical protein